MDPQRQIIALIHAELMKAQTKNPSYSLRALARKLESSPSTLSEILNGKRHITKRTGERLLRALCISPSESQKIVSQLPVRYSNNGSAHKQNNGDTFQKISPSHFDVIANWYYFGILSLAETKDFKSDPTWIAKRLGIRLKETKKAIQQLVSLGMLKTTKSGKLKATGKQFKTSTDVLNLSIQKNHREHLDILERSLAEDSVDKRDFSSITITFDPEKISKAKELIKKFRRSFNQEMEKQPKKEVYKLSIQLIPMSKEVTE